MFDFLNNLIEFLGSSLLLVFNLLVYLINLAVWLICGLINFIVNLLPNSPFLNISIFEGVEEYLGYLNWLIPIDWIIGITLTWAGCMAAYKGYSIIMRYFNIIE